MRKINIETKKRHAREALKLATKLCGSEAMAVSWLEHPQACFLDFSAAELILSGDGSYVIRWLKEQLKK